MTSLIWDRAHTPVETKTRNGDRRGHVAGKWYGTNGLRGSPGSPNVAVMAGARVAIADPVRVG